MHVTTITYSRLINSGSYENFRFEMTAGVAEGESVEIAAMELRATVHAAIRAELDRRPDTYRGSWPDLFPRDEPGMAVVTEDAD